MNRLVPDTQKPEIRIQIGSYSKREKRWIQTMCTRDTKIGIWMITAYRGVPGILERNLERQVLTSGYSRLKA